VTCSAETPGTCCYGHTAEVGVGWKLEDLIWKRERERERELCDCLKTEDSSIYEGGNERRYIQQRPPGLDGDVGIMSRPPQHKLPFTTESRTCQRNPIQQSPEHVNAAESSLLTVPPPPPPHI